MCGLKDKQACRQTLAACLLTDLCEDTKSSASLPYLLKHSQSMMNGGLFQFSSSMHILKKGCKILLGSEFTTFWFDSHARGLVRDEVFLIALGYFVWVGGLTHHAREDVQRVAELFFFLLKTTVFLQQAVDSFKQQWVTEEKKKENLLQSHSLWVDDGLSDSKMFLLTRAGFVHYEVVLSDALENRPQTMYAPLNAQMLGICNGTELSLGLKKKRTGEIRHNWNGLEVAKVLPCQNRLSMLLKVSGKNPPCSY